MQVTPSNAATVREVLRRRDEFGVACVGGGNGKIPVVIIPRYIAGSIQNDLM